MKIVEIEKGGRINCPNCGHDICSVITTEPDGFIGEILCPNTVCNSWFKVVIGEGQKGKKNKFAKPSGYWWCQECKEEVGSFHVTNDERHSKCGGSVTWIHSNDPTYEELETMISILEGSLDFILDRVHENTEAGTKCPKNINGSLIDYCQVEEMKEDEYKKSGGNKTICKKCWKGHYMKRSEKESGRKSMRTNIFNENEILKLFIGEKLILHGSLKIISK